jgi:diadenosine tetraphosphatase ApaH/serine/threonine PP2A family protein phosphatase
MKVAALYDVHGMPWALEAVLPEVDGCEIVFGGDFIYGPYPQETVVLVKLLSGTVVRGNCEETPSDWDREHVSADALAWAASLPLTVERDGVVYCHATPTSNLPPTTAATDADIVAEQFAGVTGTVVIGHTHHQFDRRVGDVRVVNAGSVGMPYEGEVAAFWTLVEDGEPRPMRTPIDVERAIREIRASGWPKGEEFIAENLLVAITRDEAIAEIEAAR